MAYQNSATHLDPDHPNSDSWPEVFCNGREQFSEDFYRNFPWARGIDPFEEWGEDAEGFSMYPEWSRGGLPPDRSAEAPPVIAFVEGLISLELDEIGEDDRRCPIVSQIR